MKDDVLTRVQALEPIAAELNLTMAQLAVAWVLANDNVAAALVGAVAFGPVDVLHESAVI